MADDRDHDHDRLDALALDLMQRSRIIDMHESANELAALVRDTLGPIPELPHDPAEREAVLADLLLEARDRSRRLLALVSSDVRC